MKQKYLSDFLSLLGQIISLEKGESETILNDVKHILDSVSSVHKKNPGSSVESSKATPSPVVFPKIVVSPVVKESNAKNVQKSLPLPVVLNKTAMISNSMYDLPDVVDDSLREFCNVRSQLEIAKYFRVSQPIVSIWARKYNISTIQKKR